MMADVQGPATASRSAKRSKTGCPECRKRRIKCDEKRPVCGQCQKSGRRCRIVDSVFMPHVLSSESTATHRRGRNTSLPPPQSRDEEHDSGDDDGQDFGLTRPSSQHAGLPTAVNFSLSTADGGLTHVTAPGSISSILRPSLNHGEDQDLPTAAADAPSPLMSNVPTNRQLPSHYPTLPQIPIQYTSPEASKTPSDRLEEDFFIRYFSETIAPWFDVVNFQRYFGHECIVLTRDNSLLRYATCSLAAKQLGQSSKRNPKPFTSIAQKDIAQQLTRGNLDFAWYGAKYYDKAIKTLARSITPREPQMFQSPPGVSPAGSLPQSDMMTRAEGEDPIVRLLATCVLIQYENLSGNTRGWCGHLNGFDKLLTLLDDGSLFYTNPLSQQIFDAKSQRALRAAFWWWAINDLEESFVAHRKLRIDTENLSLWRHMGLHMDDDGEIIELDSSGTPDAPPHLQEDLLSFALVKLLCKLVNSVSQSEDARGVPQLSPQQNFGSRVGLDTNEFQTMQQDFDKWSARSTAAFCADHTWHVPSSNLIPNTTMFDYETWYSHSFRAVTMLYYHMARMLLLIHQPPSLLVVTPASGCSSFDLLHTLRDVERRLQGHAREIVSITNGMVEYGAVRIRAVQPLYVAGRSLTNNADRRQLVRMIRSIQDDLGTVCEYRVESLMQEWGTSFEVLELQSRGHQSYESEA